MTIDRVRIVQISDPHVGWRGDSTGREGNEWSRLDAALNQARALRADTVLLSGDLIDRTATIGYATLGARLEEFRRTSGIPVVPLMGNHDRLHPFLDGLAPLLAGAERRTPETADHHRVVGGLQLVALDSTVPGEAYGSLQPEQLGWLHEVVQRAGPLGTCISLHHPPVRSPMPQLHYVMLADRHALAEAIEGAPVRIVLCGHYHHTSTAIWAGHLVWCAPALTYSQDLTVPATTVHGWPDPHLSVIDIDQTSVVCTTATVNQEGDQPALVTHLDPDDQRRRWDARARTHHGITS